MTTYAPTGGSAVREDIALSWQRSTRSGLAPASCLTGPRAAEVDVATPLLAGAAPVLEELENDLQGSQYSTLLVDRDCRVIRRWCDDRGTEQGFDSLDLNVGMSLLEDHIGTNAPGTAMVVGRGVAVNGGEHFAEALRSFSCYGQPIHHPLTRRIEGVLDISMLGEGVNPLLPALVGRAVRDIEQRLLDGSRASEKNLLLAFQAATAKARKPVVAMGEDIVLSNGTANDLLSIADLTLIRILVAEHQHDRAASLLFDLDSGESVKIEIDPVAGAPRSALVRITPATVSRALARPGPPRQDSTTISPRLVSGAPGTGRTTRARQIAEAHPPLQIVRPALALVEGAAAWARHFEAALAHRRGTVLVDGIDLLPDEVLELVTDRLATPGLPRMIFTSGPLASLTGRAAALAGAATDHEVLVPLSARRQDIPTLAAALLREVAPTGRVHLAPSLVELLASQSWPGNFHELRSVICHLADRRSVGALTIPDLPSRYQMGLGDEGRLNARERAERDVIIGALKAVDGNKVRAAEQLCMSRTTLYARMRALSITSY